VGEYGLGWLKPAGAQQAGYDRWQGPGCNKGPLCCNYCAGWAKSLTLRGDYRYKQQRVADCGAGLGGLSGHLGFLLGGHSKGHSRSCVSRLS
jgi:hypothetical protein